MKKQIVIYVKNWILVQNQRSFNLFILNKWGIYKSLFAWVIKHIFKCLYICLIKFHSLFVLFLSCFVFVRHPNVWHYVVLWLQEPNLINRDDCFHSSQISSLKNWYIGRYIFTGNMHTLCALQTNNSVEQIIPNSLKILF